MGLTRFPHGVSSFGVPVMGGNPDIPVTTGSYFFVDSTTGSNANDGQDPDHPVADIDYAVGLCTANKGDVIIVMPNHSETVSAAAGIDLDKEGITVVGLGRGLNRPQITFSGSSAADMDVDADSVTIKNLYFNLSCTQTNPTLAPIDVNDHDFTVEDCEFMITDTAAGPTQVIVATNVNNLRVLNSKFMAYTGSTATVPANIIDLQTDGKTDGASGRGHEIAGCIFDAAVSEAHIWSTASGMEMLWIHNNSFRCNTAAVPGISIGATTVANHGTLAYNLFQGLTSGSQIANLGMLSCFENYFTSASALASGLISPPVYASSD